jgi:glucose-6-phosphate dehydrogenase assembly protein OpcA
MTVRTGLDGAALERELRSQWRAAGLESEEAPVTRAALLNLIVCAPETASAVAPTVAQIAAALPCRALVLETAAAGTSAPAVEGWAALHCRKGAGGKQVCCEHLTLRVRADAVEALPSAVLGLLLPDLPTAMWAPAGVDTPLVGKLAGALDRLVTDTANAPSAAAAIARLAAHQEAGIEVSDLAWGRLDCWRELFASFFDAPPHDDALANLSDVDIEHGTAGNAAALLFAGWLVSRLGRDSFASRVRIAATSGEGLQRVAASAPRVRFVVERAAPPARTLIGRVEEDGATSLQYRFEPPDRDADTELVGSLQRTRRNQAYEDALRAAARFAPFNTGTA